MEIEIKLKELRSQAETLKQQNLRSEVAAENAQKDVSAALAELKEKFNVDGPEEAKELLDKLNEKLDSLVSEASSLVESIE